MEGVEDVAENMTAYRELARIMLVKEEGCIACEGRLVLMSGRHWCRAGRGVGLLFGSVGGCDLLGGLSWVEERGWWVELRR